VNVHAVQGALNREAERPRKTGILLRTAVLSWVLIALTLGLFILMIIPYQKEMLTERLKSTAAVIATSIDQVTVTSIVVEDYSSVVDHCIKVVNDRPAVLYIVITRRDGFSLVHVADQWRKQDLSGYWRPRDRPDAVGSFIDSDLVEEQVFHYAYPLRYSGIDWGWINIGLSLKEYERDLAAIYERTLLLSGFCLLAASVLTLFFARRLIRPILSLNRITRRLAAGDLAARSHISSGDEVESLSNSFNQMADALEKSTDQLERRVAERTAELSQANQVLTDNMVALRAAEAAFVASQNRLQQLLTDSPAVIYSCHYDGNYETTFVSENVRQLLGFEAREFLEDTQLWYQMLHEDDRGRLLDETPDILESGSLRHDYRFCNKDGAYRWIHDASRLVRDADGNPLEIVGSMLDITDRKLAEEARASAEHELETQRALSMRSDRLRSLGEMAAGIAHELNQPLMGIRGLAEYVLIAQEEGWNLRPTDINDRATRIVEQADRMVHIIEHVRLFAREAGKPALSPVQINSVVESAVDLLGAQFRSHGLTLDTELAAGLPPVQANPFSLEEVLLNLVNNARDAVETEEHDPDEPPRVLIRTQTDGRAPNLMARIEVVDQGPGIPQDIIAKVFDPFFTTKDPDKGTGLGLAIAKGIVEEFGGELKIRSEAGTGTIATINLPASADL
jgi:PAS domain S-box-containing protein